MSTRFDDYQKVLRNEKFHRELQTTMMAAQTALMMNMSGSLNNLQSEMAAIRQLNLEGLAIQQEMLQREQLQGHLEEFIYNTDKMIQEFSNDGCEVPSSAKYFSLRGVIETVQQVGIGTALIRGRENKAAFEAAMQSVQKLVAQLQGQPEVVEALDWVKSEQKRIAEAKREQEDQQRQHAAQQQAKREQILQEIARLKSTCKSFGFNDWYKPKFGELPPLTQALLWLVYGFFWIPGWYFAVKGKAEREMNSTIHSEVARLEQQLASLQ